MLQYPYPVSAQLVTPLLERIQFLAKVLESVPVSPTVASTVFHRQQLKSSLFSARIEGNVLTLGQVDQLSNDPQDLQKKEVDNCLRALRFVKTLPKALTMQSIKDIHAQLLEGLHGQAGIFRSEQSGIFDASGSVVYLTPDRLTMQQMLEIWLVEANKEREPIEHLLDVARLHYYFEKIHPLIDGNGRTGRVLLQWQLEQSTLFGEFTLPIDQYFDEHKASYYAYMERSTRHTEEFTSFVLEGIVWSLEQILLDLKRVGEEQLATSQNQRSNRLGLLPRREELVSIIHDHPLCSFDLLSRRFPTIPVRTLANDLQWLVKHDYVIKHGSTRGVRYSIKATGLDR